LQLATISSIAASLDIKLIETSSGSNQDNLPVVPAFLWIARMIGAHPPLDGRTDRGDYMEGAMTSA